MAYQELKLFIEPRFKLVKNLAAALGFIDNPMSDSKRISLCKEIMQESGCMACDFPHPKTVKKLMRISYTPQTEADILEIIYSRGYNIAIPVGGDLK